MAEKQLDGTFDPKALPGLGAERTTAEVVRDIIAKDPTAHSVTIEERKRRAIEEAKRLEAENKAFFAEEWETGPATFTFVGTKAERSEHLARQVAKTIELLDDADGPL